MYRHCGVHVLITMWRQASTFYYLPEFGVKLKCHRVLGGDLDPIASIWSSAGLTNVVAHLVYRENCSVSNRSTVLVNYSSSKDCRLK